MRLEEGLAQGAWVELLGPVRGRRVQVRDATGGPARGLLEQAGAELVEDPEDGELDAVVLADVPLPPPVLRAARRALRPGGRLLLVTTNPLSPLALADALRDRRRLRGRPLGLLRRAARRAGFPAVHAFAVLRSVAWPSTVFSLEQPGAARLVLRASNSQNTGLRRLGVDLLASPAVRPARPLLVPAHALLCADTEPEDVPVGRIGPGGATEAKWLLGSPVRAVVKTYSSPGEAQAELDALERVHRAWPGLAPAVLEREGDRRALISFVPGQVLPLDALDDAEVRHWVAAACRTMGALHRRVGPGPDGQQLVHGDYWLGNVLVEGRDVVGIIDWAEAGWGPADTDVRHLVDAWVARRALPPQAAAVLHRLAARAYAEGVSG